ncbi:hypothetical protein MMC17_004737 [Xylographa soralifera]|nr:hypothetical protein [Xylographa soralifera]
MVLALTTCIVNTGFCIVSAYHGLGDVNADYSDYEQLHAARLLFISQAFGIIGAALARISVALYEMYLFGSSVSVVKNSRIWLWRQFTNHKIVLWVNVAAQILVNSGALLQVYLQCRPVAKQWDSGIQGTCVSPEVHVKLGYFQGGVSAASKIHRWYSINKVKAVNTCTALTLSVLPMLKLRHLQMSTIHRVGISVLLGIGVLDAVACLAKTTLLGMLAAPEDYLYSVSPLVMAWTIEQYLTITCGCIPYLPQFAKELAARYGDRRSQEWRTPVMHLDHVGNCGTNVVERSESKRASSASWQRLMRARATSWNEDLTVEMEISSSSTLNAAEYHQNII